MTAPDRCTGVRSALTAGIADDPDRAHVRDCAACAAFARSLDDVDAALALHADLAAEASLPADLRARLLATAQRDLAVRPARTGGPRGRLLEMSLRLGAVAALLWAVIALTPEPLRAAEIELPRFDGLGDRVRSALDGTLAAPAGLSLRELSSGLTVPELVQPGWFAALAVLLLAGGLVLVRSGGRS